MKLIVDVGMHLGEDTGYYLSRGYRVTAIDADPDLITAARTRFASSLSDGTLSLLNYAISSVEGSLSFVVSQNTMWSSVNPQIAARGSLPHRSITVLSMPLSDILLRTGIPHYCKIDIEGADEIALRSLLSLKEKPRFISAESECVDGGETVSDERALGILRTLERLGYRKFKLVDQATLCPLKPGQRFYRAPFTTAVRRRIRTLVGLPNERACIAKRAGYAFPPGASGPFGDDIEGPWYAPDQAAEMLLWHRAQYFSRSDAVGYGFWCDWHAALD